MNPKVACNLSESNVHKAFLVFQDVVTQAEQLLRKNHYHEAAVCAQIAAQYAFVQHPGIFASPRLEQILLTIGQKITQGVFQSTRRTLRDGLPQHVLHVLSSARPIGGDTRFVWRWIQKDAERCHSVALTRQKSFNVEIPQALLDSVSRARGNLYVLDQKQSSLISRALTLRKISEHVDLIVLHLFPDDIIPSIAFANKENLPPIIFANLADHTFWVGVNISDIFVHLRKCGVRLSLERRGIEMIKTILLPTPLTQTCRTLSRSQAKEIIGYSEDTIIILSIATAYKYTPLFKPSFIDAIAPVLERYKNVVLLVIGPDNEGQWLQAFQRTQGRIVALGRRSDTAIFYEAADIYVDSFPFSSITSLLEAGSYGVPLVSYCPHSEEAEVLCAGAPGLVDTLIRVSDLKHYEVTISQLIKDVDFRLRVGEATKEKILDTHSRDDWNRCLQRVYLKTAEILPITIMPNNLEDEHVGELDILVNHLYGSFNGLGSIIDRYARYLPYISRLRLLVKMLNLTRAFSFGMFLPEWLETRVSERVKGWRCIPGIAKWLDVKE